MKKEKNKVIFPSLDLTDPTSLPERYFFNKQESLTENKFIDENSLFIYYNISKGFFSNKSSSDFNSTSSFLNLRPFELTKIDFISFLLSVSKKYNLKIENIKAFLDVKESECEISDEPKRNKEDHTLFSLNSVQESKIKDDISFYLEAFIQGKLVRNNESKIINNTSIFQSKNILTFKKHSLFFRKDLQKMQDNFESSMTIENTFEDGCPNFEYTEGDYIKNRYAKRSFLFLHILFAFQKQGLLKILSIDNIWGLYDSEKINYQARIEILPAFFYNNLSKKLCFDKDKSLLTIDNKIVKIRKFSDPYHLIRIIFENLDEVSSEWFFSKIAEKYERENPPKDKKFYNATYQLNQKIVRDTGIKDFFITTTQSVKINNTYLR